MGLLSGSAVCDSRWRGVAPTSTPNKSTSETRRSLRSEVSDGPSSTRGKEPSTSVGGSFCFAGALRDGVVYSAWFNNSEFERRKLMYPLISVFIIVVGALLLVFANKIIKNNKVNRIGIKVVGGILIIVGLLLLYFLLSGKLTLPLSK